MKKNILTAIASFMVAICGMSQTSDRVFVDDIHIESEGQLDIAVKMDNPNNVFCAFQFDMYLPDGVSIAMNESGELDVSLNKQRKKANHHLSAERLENEYYRFVCFSMTNSAFSGQEGPIVDIKLKTDSPLPYDKTLTGSIENIILTKADGRDCKPSKTTFNIVFPIKVSAVSLNKSEMNIYVGNTSQLSATIYPSNASDKTVVWTSSDSKVATVDENGLVKAIAEGNAIVTASCGKVKAECAVKVLKKSQTVTWTQTFNNVKAGDKIELKATASSGLEVVYTVLEGNAVVQGNSITFYAHGLVRVEASQPGNDEFSAAMAVVKSIDVPITASGIKLNYAKLELRIGSYKQLTATVYPTNAIDRTVVWTSSDDKIATVGKNGLVKAIAAGNAIITASCGEVKAQCQVTILKKEQTITWKQDFDNASEGDTIKLNAKSSSGLDIVYMVTEGNATIVGNVLTINTSGMVSIKASQPGNDEFNPAEPIVKTFNATSGISDSKSDSKQDIYFDLQGRAVKSPKKGIYIVNGRKIVTDDENAKKQ